MKKKMTLEKWKRKTIAMLMTGVMVFAMAPLGTGIAFADEEDAESAEEPAVEATEDVVIEAPEDVVVEAPEEKDVDEPEEATVHAAKAEAKGVLKDLGVYTMDLSKGPKKVAFDFQGNLNSEQMIVFTIMQGGGLGDKYVYGDQGPQGKTYIDLDGQGEAFDIEMYPDEGTNPNTASSSMVLCFAKLSTSNIKDNYTIMLTDAERAMYASVTNVPPGVTGFYSGIKFVFKAAAPAKPKPIVKKANTLTLKAKTTKIKYKKLRKKTRTYAISKFITVSKAQGAVTYAKASGNKKIKISKDGKVTIKKKIKKGKYKVKVNVTAAGNANYNKITKAVTFVVKIKR